MATRGGGEDVLDDTLARVLIWTGTVTVIGLAVLQLPVLMGNKTAVHAIISPELALTGFLIGIGGLGDLAYAIFNTLCGDKKRTRKAAGAYIANMITCALALAVTLMAYGVLQDADKHAVTGETVAWAVAPASLAIVSGTSAVWLAAIR
ncbi:hypothetical protein AB5J56_25975 [Streptomyces sp. R21]|uniref:Uncharacterized protein n=1 Tax=Streptomyces sp. R21 TaxID=3238627 RepID=A0AB39PE35_9ACTN